MNIDTIDLARRTEMATEMLVEAEGPVAVTAALLASWCLCQNEDEFINLLLDAYDINIADAEQAAYRVKMGHAVNAAIILAS